jgi:probable rRNA maturation factor
MGPANDGRSRTLMLEVEVFGESGGARAVPSPEEVRGLCIMAAASAGIQDGHVAVEFVDAERIARLNAEHRSQPRPTDVLSFPIDGVEPLAVRELGDVVICPEHTVDVREAVVHGMLHLLGMDHETDDGEMLALQRELLAREAG